MSRIGKKTIALPKGVDVTVSEGNVVVVRLRSSAMQHGPNETA